MRNSLSVLLITSALFAMPAFSAAQASPERDKPVLVKRCDISEYVSVELMDNISDTAKEMRYYVSPQDFMNFYSPLRKLATRARISMTTYGLASATTAKSLKALAVFVNVNSSTFEDMLDIEAFSDVGYMMLETAEKLERDLR